MSKKVILIFFLCLLIGIVYFLIPDTGKKANAAGGATGDPCIASSQFPANCQTGLICFSSCSKCSFGACPGICAPSLPPVPAQIGGLHHDSFDDVPIDVIADKPTLAVNYDPTGTFHITAHLSSIYNKCQVNPGEQSLGYYVIAIDNKTGQAPASKFSKTNAYVLKPAAVYPQPAYCESSDKSVDLNSLPFDPQNGTWYDIFVTSFFPNNNYTTRDFVHTSYGGIASRVVQVLAGPNKNPPPWIPNNTLKCPVTSTAPTVTCDDLKKNSGLVRGQNGMPNSPIACHADWQCSGTDPGDAINHKDQQGRYLVCPKGFDCRQLFAGVQNPQTYCLLPSEGEQKCGHHGDSCNLNGGGQRCCNKGENNNTENLQCTPPSGGDTTARCLPPGPSAEPSNPPPPSPPCVKWDPTTASCVLFATDFGQIGTSITDFITQVFTALLGMSGGIAVLLIIRAGYRLTNSQGKPEAIQQGREELIAAIVGLMFLIFSFIILQVIGVDILKIPGLGGGTNGARTGQSCQTNGFKDKAGGCAKGLSCVSNDTSGTCASTGVCLGTCQ